MKIVNVDRGSGKTAYLISKSQKENKPILVATALRARNLARKAIDLGYSIPTPISVYDLVAGSYVDVDEACNGVLVDEFDEVFDVLMSAKFGLRVEESTCSIDKTAFESLSRRTAV